MARELSERFGAGNDLAEAAGMLHDCTDAVMSRFADGHEEKSLEIARKLLSESGFSAEEITIVVDDAIKNHSCRGENLPQTTEGKIMSTADAKAHLATDFYDFLRTALEKRMTEEEIQAKLSEKIDRDFNIKIFFPEIQEELREVYEKKRRELIK